MMPDFFSILGQKDIARIIYFVLLEYIPGTQSNIYYHKAVSFNISRSPSIVQWCSLQLTNKEDIPGFSKSQLVQVQTRADIKITN